MVRVALAQFPAEPDVSANLDTIAGYARQAAGVGAGLLVLPELCSTIFPAFENDRRHFATAQAVDGPEVDRIRSLAVEHGLVIAYPFFERGPEGRFYSAAVLIGPQGDLLGHYRKAHIPRVESGLAGQETFYLSPGDLPYRVWDTPLGIRIGMVICFDRYFPEGPRLLALQGADLLLVPAVAAPGGRRWWELMYRAYAVQNMYYVAAVNKAGAEPGGAPVAWYGNSLLVSPNGDVVVQAGEEPGLVWGDLDPAFLAQHRAFWHFLADRRTDLCAGGGE